MKRTIDQYERNYLARVTECYRYPKQCHAVILLSIVLARLSMEAEENVPSDYAWREWLAVTYRCDVSALYNRKRERFFTLCDRWSKVLSLIASGAAFSSFLEEPEQKAMAAVVVSAVTLPSLLFAWSDKARLHGELAQKYLALRAEISRVGKRDFTEKDIDNWDAEISIIEQTEPSILSAVLAECSNHIASREYEPEKIVKLSVRQKIFAHLFDTHVSWPAPKESEAAD